MGVPVEQVEASFLYVRSGREDVHTDLLDAAGLEALLRGNVEVERLTLL